MPSRKTTPEPTPSPDVETLDFEQALDELEKLVGELERGEQPLEQSLAAFERGVALTRRCQAALKAAEQKVEILSREAGAGDAQPRPFEPGQ
jgi:exodeoxyribonuclease VII small subunit